MSLSGNDLMGLVGQTVKVNRGGPDSLEGVLLSVQHTYMAVWAKDKKMVYINTTHVKSITASGQSGGVQSQSGGSKSGGSRSGGMRSGGMRSGGVQSAMARPIHAFSFTELLQSLQFRHVQINRGGPEKIEGIIISANQSFLILAVRGEEVVRIPIFHIKSVTVLGTSSNNSKGNKKGNNQSGGNQSGANSNQGNRTGGNRTGGNQTGVSRSGGSRTGGNQVGANRTGGNRSWGRHLLGDAARNHLSGGNRTIGVQRNKKGTKTRNRRINRSK